MNHYISNYKIYFSKYGLEVSNFGSSWRDGTCFLAIISCINPALVDVNSYAQASNKQRLESAFSIAEQELGISRLLDAEDVDVENPDEKSVMTYVAQFLHKYPDPAAQQDVSINSKPLSYQRQTF